MKYLLMVLMFGLIVSCAIKDNEPKPEYQCVEIIEENYVKGGCKIGDFHNVDLDKCSSTMEKCLNKKP